MNNEADNSKPSPYLGLMTEPSEGDQEFIRKITEICHDHGFDSFFIAFSSGNTTNPKIKQYKGFSNTLNSEMVHYLEVISKAMRQAWEAIKPPKK